MVSGLAESSFKDVPEIFEVGNVLFCCFVTHANYDGASLLAALLLFLRPGTPVGLLLGVLSLYFTCDMADRSTLG